MRINKEQKIISKKVDVDNWTSDSSESTYKIINFPVKSLRILIVILKQLRTGYLKEENISLEDKNRIVNYIYNIEKKLIINRIVNLSIEEYQFLYVFFSRNIKQLDQMILFYKKKLYKVNSQKYFSFSLKGFFLNIGVFSHKFFIGTWYYVFQLFLQKRRKKLSYLLSIITK